jgi:hypothetical protein
VVLICAKCVPEVRDYASALYGAAGVANNPAITELLLDRGANRSTTASTTVTTPACGCCWRTVRG